MPRTCTICTHPQRAALEAQLVAGIAYRTIADHFSVSKTALIRHAGDHVKQQIAQAQEAREEAQSLDVVRQLKAINAAAIAILAAARRTGEHDIALKAIDRIQRQLELQAKLLGTLDERTVVNVMLNPDWYAMSEAVERSLAPYGPQAQIDVAAALYGTAHAQLN